MGSDWFRHSNRYVHPAYAARRRKARLSSSMVKAGFIHRELIAMGSYDWWCQIPEEGRIEHRLAPAHSYSLCYMGRGNYYRVYYSTATSGWEFKFIRSWPRVQVDYTAWKLTQ